MISNIELEIEKNISVDGVAIIPGIGKENLLLHLTQMVWVLDLFLHESSFFLVHYRGYLKKITSYLHFLPLPSLSLLFYSTLYLEP